MSRTYLYYINDNQQIVVLQINRMRWADGIRDCLDDDVAIEFIVVSHCWANGVLEATINPGPLLVGRNFRPGQETQHLLSWVALLRENGA